MGMEILIAKFKTGNCDISARDEKMIAKYKALNPYPEAPKNDSKIPLSRSNMQGKYDIIKMNKMV
jgi:hypothetical protein